MSEKSGLRVKVTNREFTNTLWNELLRVVSASTIAFLFCVLSPGSSRAQTEVTGAIEGLVVNSVTGEPIAGATVRIINFDTGLPYAVRTDGRGRFFRGLLVPGRYNVIISAPGFKTIERAKQRVDIEVTNAFLPYSLEPESKSGIDLNTSGQTFVGDWESLNLWEAPTNWQANSGRLLVNERGVAFPRDKSYRSYSDFSLTSDIKMLNGVAASFIVHAVDTRNYYLIQLTGPNADQPYVLRGFVVKNGVSQPWKSIPIDTYSTTLQPGRFFEVSMKMTGNNLEVSVTDSETGTQLRLGVLSDPNLTFRVGAVGIAVRDNEQNEIGRFIVSLF